MKSITLLYAFLLLTIFQSQAQDGWGEIQKLVPDDRYVGQQFGWDVDIDGNFAVVGNRFQQQVYVFRNDGNNNWTQHQKLEGPDFQQFDHFGNSVAIYGDYIFVSSVGQDFDDLDFGNYVQDAGAVYVFKRDTAFQWNLIQKLTPSERYAFNEFGNVMEVNGSKAVIGVTRHDYDLNGENPLNDAGAAYIFTRDQEGVWNEVQKIVAADRGELDYFGGFGIGMDGDFLAIGAPFEDEDSTGQNTIQSAGAIYIFQRQDEVWTQTQKVVASDREQGEWFGFDIAMNGNDMIVSASQADSEPGGDGNSLVGAVYAFEQTDAETWAETQIITGSDCNAGDRFGTSIDLTDGFMISGAHFQAHSEGGFTYGSVGAAYIFEKELTPGSSWNQVQKIYGSNWQLSDHFGYSVAISGGLALVGAYDHDTDQNGENYLGTAGAAYLFDINAPNTSTGIAHNSIPNFKAFPNPTTGNLNIDLGANYAEVRVTVTNLLGQEVLQKRFDSVPQFQLQLDIPEGLYVVNIQIDNSISAVVKVLKER